MQLQLFYIYFYATFKLFGDLVYNSLNSALLKSRINVFILQRIIFLWFTTVEFIKTN